MNSTQTPPMQSSLLLESIQSPSVNLVQWILELPANTDLNRVEAAIQKIHGEYPSLNCVISGDGASSEPRATPSPDDVTVARQELEARDSDEARQQLEEILAIDRHSGFRSAEASLFRSRILTRAGKENDLLIVSYHLSILDNYSFSILLRRLIELVRDPQIRAIQSNEAETKSVASPVESLSNPSLWRELIENHSGEPSLPKLPLGTSEKAYLVHHWQHETRLSETDFVSIKSGLERLNVHLETLAHAAWTILLHRYCNSDDLIFGGSASYRDQCPSHELGPYFNTFPIRAKIDHQCRVIDLLEELEAQRQSRTEFPLTPLVEVFQGHQYGQTLLGTGITVEDASWQEVLEIQPSPWSEINIEDRYETSFSLVCNLRCYKGLTIRFNYDVDKFEEAGIQQISRHYTNLLTKLLETPEALVYDVEMLDDEDLTEYIQQPPTLYSKDFSPVYKSIYLHAEKNPKDVAITFDETNLTFAELVKQTDALAARLIQSSAGKNTIVAVCLPRSPEFVISILATHRAGAAYLPIDSSEPPERAMTMLKDAKVGLVITNSGLASHFSPLPEGNILLFKQTQEDSFEYPLAVPDTKAEDLAYVIFTSGSTGKPKGVMIEHRNMLNHFDGVTKAFDISKETIALQFSALNFDVHVEEIFTTLANGARLVLRDDEMGASAKRFFAGIESFDISLINIPTAFWTSLVEDVRRSKTLWPKCIRTLVVGGESISSATYTEFRRQKTEHITFINGYGPTEATVTSTYFVVSASDAKSLEAKLSHHSLPIGRPLEKVTHFLLDNHLRPVPLGTVGELYIGGLGVARGYICNEELNRLKFITLPLPIRDAGRVYSTGDQVFSDGTDYYFAGRKDYQVKVSGFRIELNEVEAAIQSCDGVKQAVADMQIDKSRGIVAFVESLDDPEELKIKLTTHLQRLLPAYMQPRRIECIKSFPVTRSGKIDRTQLLKSLEELDDSSLEPSLKNRELSTRQKSLALLWQDLLGCKAISMTDSFFELGGHSLLAVKLFSLIENEFGILVPIREFFSNPTIQQLDKIIEKYAGTEDSDPLESSETGSLLCLQADGDGCPIYCICGLDIYQELANNLGNTQPVFGIFLAVEEQMLHQFTKKRGKFSFPSVPEMAAEYIKIIRKNQPYGPYKLAGISFGGILAFEIAMQLTKAGESIENLILIDSFVPHKRKIISRKRFQGQLIHLRNDGFGYFSWMFKRIIDICSDWKKTANSPRIISNQRELPTDADFNLYRSLVYRKAALNYELPDDQIKAKTTLIHAIDAEINVEGTDSYDHGWGKYISTVRRVDIQGDHIGVLKTPNVVGLANAIAPELKKSKYVVFRESEAKLQDQERDLQLETLLEPVFIASNYMGDDGRPLAEITATNEVKKGIVFDMRRCPYSGSRYEKDMNASALPSLSQQIRNVISDTINLRSIYLSAIGRDSFDLESFWFFTRVLDTLPVYLVRRSLSPIDRLSVPARVSAMFKAAQGLHLAPEVMLLSGQDPKAAVDVEQLLKFIEEKGLFIDEGRACAGPPSMIKAFVKSAVEGVGYADDLSELNALLGENGTSNLFSYADGITRIYAKKILFEAYCRSQMLSIIEEIAYPSLNEIYKHQMSRFGVLGESEDKIELVQKHFEDFGFDTSSAETYQIENEDKLVQMVRLRNPELTIQKCQQSVRLMLQNIADNDCWMQRLTERQLAVIQARGIKAPPPAFSQNMISSLGYVPSEIIAKWLRLELIHGGGTLKVVAGASWKTFNWISS